MNEIFSKWEVNHFSLDPMVAAAAWGKQKGKDSEVLDLKADEKKVKENVEVVESVGESEQKIDNTEDTEKLRTQKNKVSIWHILGGVIIALLVGVGLFFVTAKNTEPSEEEKLAMEAAVATPTPSPTPVNLADYKIEVLNGSGIGGEAGRIKDLLIGEGFGEIETGNADSYDYGETEVEYREDLESEVWEKIVEVLAEERETTSSADLESEDFDVRVTLGELKEE